METNKVYCQKCNRLIQADTYDDLHKRLREHLIKQCKAIEMEVAGI